MKKKSTPQAELIQDRLDFIEDWAARVLAEQDIDPGLKVLAAAIAETERQRNRAQHAENRAANAPSRADC